MKNPIVNEKRLQFGKRILTVGGTSFLVRSYQLVIWTTLQRPGTDLSASAVWIPAVIDTGFNDTFLISQTHLELLAEYDRFVRVDVEKVWYQGELSSAPRMNADLWIRSEVDGIPDLKIEADAGLLCFPERGSRARPVIPLLGQAALAAAGLRLEVDYWTLRYSLYRASRPDLAEFVRFLDDE